MKYLMYNRDNLNVPACAVDELDEAGRISRTCDAFFKTPTTEDVFRAVEAIVEAERKSDPFVDDGEDLRSTTLNSISRRVNGLRRNFGIITAMVILAVSLCACSEPCVPEPGKECPATPVATGDGSGGILNYFLLYHLFSGPSRSTTVYVPQATAPHVSAAPVPKPSYSAPKATRTYSSPSRGTFSGRSYSGRSFSSSGRR